METFDDTARNGANYQGLSRVLNFEPSITNLSVAINLIYSSTPETVTFWAVLSSATNGTVESPNGAAFVHVLDTDCKYLPVCHHLALHFSHPS